MKTLKRNQRDFEYIPLLSVGTDVNGDGDHTGDYSEPTYGTPIWYAGNISVPSGQSVHTFYGEDIRYTHVLVMDKPEEEFNEYGLVRFEGKMYEIKAVRPTINSFSAALRQMTPDEEVIIPEETVGGDTDGSVDTEEP